MVCGTRGRCNDDAMKFFSPDKKKYDFIEPNAHPGEDRSDGQ